MPPDRAILMSLVLFAVGPTIASAQDVPGLPAAGDPAPESAEAPPESAEDAAMAQSLEDMEARANFEAGRVAFAAARYADALGYFEHAHELSGRHPLLYNIGLCHDRLGHDAEALESFERYLESAPDAHNRAEVEQRIATARERLDRVARVEIAPAAVTDAGPDPAAWALLGVGAALAASGAVLVTVGRLDVAAIEAIPDGTRAWSAVAADAERADALTIAGAVGLGVGAALAATGIAWAVSGGGSGATEPAPPAVSVRLGPGSLSLAGRF